VIRRVAVAEDPLHPVDVGDPAKGYGTDGRGQKKGGLNPAQDQGVGPVFLAYRRKGDVDRSAQKRDQGIGKACTSSAGIFIEASLDVLAMVPHLCLFSGA